MDVVRNREMADACIGLQGTIFTARSHIMGSMSTKEGPAHTLGSVSFCFVFCGQDLFNMSVVER